MGHRHWDRSRRPWPGPLVAARWCLGLRSSAATQAASPPWGTLSSQRMSAPPSSASHTSGCHCPRHNPCRPGRPLAGAPQDKDNVLDPGLSLLCQRRASPPVSLHHTHAHPAGNLPRAWNLPNCPWGSLGLCSHTQLLPPPSPVSVPCPSRLGSQPCPRKPSPTLTKREASCTQTSPGWDWHGAGTTDAPPPVSAAPGTVPAPGTSKHWRSKGLAAG